MDYCKLTNFTLALSETPTENFHQLVAIRDAEQCDLKHRQQMVTKHGVKLLGNETQKTKPYIAALKKPLRAE